MPDSPLDVIVIGGGQAGLAMAWYLRRQGARFLVLDAGSEIGHVWRSRWDSLVQFTAARYDALPGLAFPAPDDTYPTKDEVADYLRAYAGTFDLPVRLNTRVTRLSRGGAGFEIGTAGDTFHARQVVVATGPFQTPALPAPAARLDRAVTQLHSSVYRSPRDLPDGPVLVVGGGNSGLQIAEELTATRRVDLSAGATPPVLPQRLLGKDLFWWLTRLGLMAKPADSWIGRRVRDRGELVIGTSRRTLRRAGVTFRPRLTGADGTDVRFEDGSTLQVGAVVWATGFRSDYSWMAVGGVLADGRPVHRRGVTNVPGLYFLGLPWQHTRSSALLGFVKDDAAYLADRIAAHARTGQRPTGGPGAGADHRPGAGHGSDAGHRPDADHRPGHHPGETTGVTPLPQGPASQRRNHASSPAGPGSQP
ncbi:flavin-containing monooxygenase [Streptosporangium sp. NPDC087985]|uniref:flavin-containing monooxygenase n=1 Tax=Streptosporangium sp. NPDC087985 TaxID=3366196 RepID=UPI003828B647